MLFIGGFLISGASVIINQIIEKDLDKTDGPDYEQTVANLPCVCQ